MYQPPLDGRYTVMSDFPSPEKSPGGVLVTTVSVAAVLVGADVTKVSWESQAAGPAIGLADAVRKVQPRWSAGARWSRLRTDIATVACSDFPVSGVHRGFALITLSDDRRVGGPRLPAPRAGQDAAAELLSHPQVLDEITAGLVRALT